MTELTPQDRQAVEEGAREAAGHVLALLDQKEPTHEFVRQLLEASPQKQVAIVSSLVHLVSRTAVESADMATFKLKLRLMAKEPMPDE
jgi:hypothetical protein